MSFWYLFYNLELNSWCCVPTVLKVGKPRFAISTSTSIKTPSSPIVVPENTRASMYLLWSIWKKNKTDYKQQKSTFRLIEKEEAFVIGMVQ